MEPIRPTYWNIPGWAQILVYLLGAVAISIFAYGVYRHIKKWRLGKPEMIERSVFERLKSSVTYALFQWRLSSDRFAIIMHLTIFWSMAILLVGTALATVDWDVTFLILDFQFLRGYFYLFYELALDIFGLLLVFGLGMAVYRRYILRPERLKTPETPTFRWDSFYLLIILLLIDLTGFIIEGLRITAQNPPWAEWAPVGYYLSTLFQPLSLSAILSIHFVFWLLHLILALVFVASIPYTKAFHIFSSALSIYFRKFAPVGALTASGDAALEKIDDFTWRQLMQVDACTWCGRCQEVCPAYASGYSLSPKNLVLKLDSQLLHYTKTNGSNSGKEEETKKLHGPVISAPELWACTTCGACEEMCPVFVEHPRMIVEMRRYLVNQGEIETLVQDTLMKMNRYGNSFGQSDRMRAKWTQDIGFTIKDARKEPVQYLWFVGDYASYDPRIQDNTKLTAKIFQMAKLDFGILFDGERNSGNDVRRVGEEGLYQLLSEKNQTVLGKAKFETIVTTDPHSYNTLKNEYRMNGHGPRVVHYTELLYQLLLKGDLTVRKNLNGRITYHDPCYLGRYNGVYEPPRMLLGMLGLQIEEMPRNRSKGFCCGAGGGRIWMEDIPGIKERPAENRVREAISLPDVNTMAVACPKDLVMFRDAVKTTGNEQRLMIKDIAEFVGDALEIQKGV